MGTRDVDGTAAEGKTALVPALGTVEITGILTKHTEGGTVENEAQALSPAFSEDLAPPAVSFPANQRYGCACPREAWATASPLPVWDRARDEA